MAAGASAGGGMAGGGGGAQGQGAPGQGGQGGAPGGQVGAVMQEFRPLADTIKQLGTKYPEGQEEAVQIMKALQQWMAKVAGNAQRTPEAQGSPNP